jgi:dipeptide/tripeptide permease
LFDAVQKGSGYACAVCVGVVLLGLGIVFSVIVALFPQSTFANMNTWIAFSCSAVGFLAVTLSCVDSSWLGEARLPGETLSGSEVRDFLRVLPVLFTGNLAFSALYNSMQFWYQQQACQMDLRLSGESQVAGSFFMIADCLGIVVATPIAVSWFNPAMESRFQRMGTAFSHGPKYGLGMIFGVLSVFVAVHLERARRGTPLLQGTSNCAPEGVQMSDISALWMVVPFFLMGLGEIYTQPVLMHLAYTQSPPAMRTLAAVAAMLIGAVSTALFTVQIAALSPFVPNDLNQGHLEYGYISNIILGGVFYVAYLGTLHFFKEKTYDA